MSLLQRDGCEDPIKIEVFVQDGLHAGGMLKKQRALRELYYREVWYVGHQIQSGLAEPAARALSVRQIRHLIV